MVRRVQGFSVVESLVSIVVISLLALVGLRYLTMHQRVTIEQELAVGAEQNLRVGMAALVDALRTSRYGLPGGVVPLWISSQTGLVGNPQVDGASPARISVMGCFQTPVATLSTRVDAGATTLPVTSASPIPSARLVLIDDQDTAWVTTGGATSISIDTDPVTAGAQGVWRAYSADAPICLVDVKTFKIQVDSSSGIPWLVVDTYNGAAAQSVVENISDLQVKTITAGAQYTITLAAKSDQNDPLTGLPVQRVLQSTVSLRN